MLRPVVENSRDKLMLLDTASLYFRAYYGVPETLTAEDPVPFRTVLFRVAVGEMTGRTARPVEA